jgi:hypothetical protein
VPEVTVTPVDAPSAFGSVVSPPTPPPHVPFTPPAGVTTEPVATLRSEHAPTNAIDHRREGKTLMPEEPLNAADAVRHPRGRKLTNMFFLELNSEQLVATDHR